MNHSQGIVIEVHSDDFLQFKRLDQFLASKVEGITRARIKNLYLQEMITSPTNKLELKKMPPSGSKVFLQIPPTDPQHTIPQNLPLKKIFEDEHLMVIEKEAGMVVHPAAGHQSGTLANAILYHHPQLQMSKDTNRPGIVHRLDKGTSGIMVVAKKQKIQQALTKDFSQHHIERKYLCLVLGKIEKESGILKSLMARNPKNRLKMTAKSDQGKEAITHYKVVERFDSCMLLELSLQTGRTHQIRSQLSQLLNTPVLMDATYGNPKRHLKHLPNIAYNLLKDYPHPLLHATLLGFNHPTNKRRMVFTTPPPPLFTKVLDSLRS